MLWKLPVDTVSATPSQWYIPAAGLMVDRCGHCWWWQPLHISIPTLLDVQESGTVEHRGLIAVPVICN